ncbi:MAG: hypothetical protein K2K04_05305, partial [Clostridia bacterium]|nr:hypothetical protein [Clostridia bacterium]
MNKKKLTRLIAVCMACLGMGIFAFAGCKKGNGGTADSGKHEEIDEGKDKDKDKDKDKEDEGKEPVISGPVAGGVKELKASENEREAAYVTWRAAVSAKW